MYQKLIKFFGPVSESKYFMLLIGILEFAWSLFDYRAELYVCAMLMMFCAGMQIAWWLTLRMRNRDYQEMLLIIENQGKWTQELIRAMTARIEEERRINIRG